MAFKVQVGPPQIAIHQGQTVLVSEPDGQIKWPSDKALYFFDTRVISAWAIYANGAPWDLLNGGAISYDAARIHLANGRFRTEAGVVPARTIGLVLARSIEGGLHEDLDITNHGLTQVRFNLEIAVRCDFADIFEVKSDDIVRRGRIATEWSDTEQRLSNNRNGDFSRKVTITPDAGGHRAVYANGRLTFPVALGPGDTWHCCLLYDLADGERRFPASERCVDERDHSDHVRARPMASRRAEHSHEQRGVLSPLPPGCRRHGRPASAVWRHRRDVIRPGGRAALVRCLVRAR